MTMAAIHGCPECGGAVNTEHYFREPCGRQTITYLYCEFCSVGWETLWTQQKNGSDIEQYTVRYSGQTDATKLGMFIQRLKAARQQAA